MNFYTVLKYILMAALLGIIVVGVLNMPSSDNLSQPAVQTQQQPQSKFNF